MELKYYVYYHRFNGKSIDKFNVFDHGRFYEDVKKNLKKYDNKEEFAEELRKDLAYYYWSKSEWEVVITSWVPSITMQELDRLNAEREEAKKKFGRDPHSLYVNPDIGEKIDVYEQVRLNWDLFVDYVWSHRRKNADNKK